MIRASDSNLDFLAGGGETGRHIRQFDWSSTCLGAPASWPQSLKTALRLVLTTQHPMFIWWGPDLVQFYNDGYSQSLGPERHPGAIGQKGRDCWEEIWPIIGPQIDQVMSGRGATWHENALVPITRNGKREDVYWTYGYSPIDDPAAARGVGGVLVVCSETTHAVLDARKLAVEREQFAQLFEQAPSFMAMLRGPEHRFEMVNPSYRKLTGYRDLAGRTVAEALPEAAAQGYVDILDRVYETGVVFSANSARISFEAVRGAPFNERFVDFVYQPIRDAAGEVTGIFVEGVDVTERTGSEAALRRTQDSLRALNADLEKQVAERSYERGVFWQLTPDMLGVLNPDGFFEKSNPAWQAILGYTEDEIRSTPFFQFLEDPSDEATVRAFAQIKRGEPVLNFVNRYRCKDGSLRWLSWNVVPENGKFYCSGRDISSEKGARIALDLAQEALRQSQKMEAVGQLTGGIAHDFNNMLAGITGNLDLLGRRLKNTEAVDLTRYVDSAAQVAQRAAALTHRLLAFSRRQTLAPKAVNANHLVGSMEELIRRTLGPDIELATQPAAGLWQALCDPNQLESAVLNLCINSRDAMPVGGKLFIRLENVTLNAADLQDSPDATAGDYVHIQVGDTGHGMSREILGRALDPFFTTKPIGQGTGLGLSMVYGFVKQSNGHIRIQSEVGAGTSVNLFLPRYSDAIEEAQAAEEDGQFIPADLGHSVLLVEDELAVREVSAEMLMELGYAVHQASDANEALLLFRTVPKIDLLITDVGLPNGMNGRQLADAVRESQPDLKVLFVTGYAPSAVFGGKVLDAGMEMMTKPYSLDKFASRVTEIIEGERLS